MVDLVFISFVKSLKLSSCMKAKYCHAKPVLEDVGQTKSQTYSFFHLRLYITDCWNCSLEFIHPFLAVDCSVMDSKVLLERPMLKDFKINICNSDDLWEFERKSKMTEITALQFAQEITLKTHVFEVCSIY